jgi:DNA-directed RNA polymerase I, II, and III subunit RPABC2
MSDYFDFENDEGEVDLDDLEETQEDETNDEEDETTLISNLDETIDLVNIQSKIISRKETYQKLNNYDDYMTSDYLTKYEYARILGLRAQQIAMGGDVYVDVGDIKDPIQKAEKEIKEGKCHLIIERLLPGQIINKPISEPRRVNELLLNH